MFWDFADYPYYALSFYNLTLFTYRFYRCPYFHNPPSFTTDSYRFSQILKTLLIFFLFFICVYLCPSVVKFHFFYLNLLGILPLVKSYGENSTFTLSPTNI